MDTPHGHKRTFLSCYLRLMRPVLSDFLFGPLLTTVLPIKLRYMSDRGSHPMTSILLTVNPRPGGKILVGSSLVGWCIVGGSGVGIPLIWRGHSVIMLAGDLPTELHLNLGH